MLLSPAPYHATPAGEPVAKAYRTSTSDGLRLRVAHWAAEGAPKGTVLLFPGRTEYIEKYAITAGELAAAGYATASIDWRGQGLSDRLCDNPMAGHVLSFPDYQADVAALLGAAEELSLPQPYLLLAHSMGGCIGLRALMEDLPVSAAAFTGPMWDIGIAAILKPIAHVIGTGARRIGLAHHLAPGTKNDTYVLDQPFEDNQLTCDRAMYDRLRDQARAHPELTLGGPSLLWLQTALAECRALAKRPSPTVPTVTILGTDEQIVSKSAIETRMANWPNGSLVWAQDGQHEILMEGPEKRGSAMRAILECFDRAV
ncbi:alpha/beta hydrolase [Cognatishimia sp. SS12]|uniref:alpha/beta hydrolase n=1 Tax=Cognatishimia sp. SS12 TaxID=2979465 RepID=UPI00232B903B|nr:alpha/beta hydrolase [Cognatishimia sp. SS12]MDC0739654.1 alpha/beta hydrolase [Cognatishimia sp. SS12]